MSERTRDARGEVGAELASARGEQASCSPTPDLSERDAKLRELGVDPEQLVDERDVQYLLGDAFREAGIELGAKEQEAVVCTLLGYRYPDQLEIGDPTPGLVLHPLDEGAGVPMGALHGERPLVLFFGSYT